MPNTDSADGWVEIARRGAANVASDNPDFGKMYAFVQSRLAAGEEQILLDLEARLRNSDRAALNWYLSLTRAAAGTVPVQDRVHHLIFAPVLASGPVSTCLTLGENTHQTADSLEHALDLGTGTVRLFDCAVPVSTLERLSPLQWYTLAIGAPGADNCLRDRPLGAAGALVGCWSVPLEDRGRLSRKLVHALRPTDALGTWKKRTESLLTACAEGSQIWVFPAMLLQDVFAGLSKCIFFAALERVRRCQGAKRLEWSWCDTASELSWKLCDGQTEEGASGTVQFPDEPWDLVSQQLQRLAQRHHLVLSPPLSSQRTSTTLRPRDSN